jgi:hypothetical protein
VEPNAFVRLHSTSTSDVHFNISSHSPHGLLSLTLDANFVTSSNLKLPCGLLTPVTSLNNQSTLGVVCDGKEVERMLGVNGQDIRIETE